MPARLGDEPLEARRRSESDDLELIALLDDVEGLSADRARRPEDGDPLHMASVWSGLSRS